MFLPQRTWVFIVFCSPGIQEMLEIQRLSFHRVFLIQTHKIQSDRSLVTREIFLPTIHGALNWILSIKG